MSLKLALRMKIFVNNSYGGDICSIKLEKEAQECFGCAIKVLGFIETNKVKIQHVSSQGKFVTDEIRFKIPDNIIPTFASKNFKVWYECECAMISKDTKTPFSFRFDIANNNFGDFYYSDPFELDLSLVGEEEYLNKKEEICRLLLSQLETPLSPKNLFKNTIKDAKDEKKEPPFGLSQDGDKSTLSFIQNNEPVFSPNISSSELSQGQSPVLPTRPATQPQLQPSAETPNGNLEANGLDSVPVLRHPNNNELTYSFESCVQHNGTEPTKVIVDESEMQAEQSNYYSQHHEELQPSGARNRPGEFSQEVNEEIQSLVAQFAAEEYALNKIKKFQEKEELQKVKNVLNVESGDEDNRENTSPGTDYEKLIQEMFEEKCKLESEFHNKLQAIQDSIRTPSFRDPNLLEIHSYENVNTVVEAEEKIAHVIYPVFMKDRSYIKIKYLRNVRNTQINIWRQDYEKDSMIDAENVFCVSFDSDNCLEKIFDFEAPGFSLKTFVFEVRYILSISLGDSEISLPINILSPASKAYISPIDA